MQPQFSKEARESQAQLSFARGSKQQRHKFIIASFISFPFLSDVVSFLAPLPTLQPHSSSSPFPTPRVVVLLVASTGKPIPRLSKISSAEVKKKVTNFRAKEHIEKGSKSGLLKRPA